MAKGNVRIAKWDNVKLVLIVLVVIGHIMKGQTEVSGAAQKLYDFVYLFHMPAFIFVSGLFARPAIDRRDYDRVFGFFLLYLFIKFLDFFEGMAVTGDTSLTLLSEPGIPWYALALSAWYAATMFLKRYDRKFLLVFAVLLGCASGYAKDIGTYLSLARILSFYPFFVFGYCLEPEKVAAFSEKRPVRVCAAATLLAFALIYIKYGRSLEWITELTKGRYSYWELDHFRQAGALLRLLHYLVGIWLTFAVIALAPPAKLPVSWIGRRTLAVYAFHMAAIEVLMDGLHVDVFLRGLWPPGYPVLLVLCGLLLVFLLALKPFYLVVRWVIAPKRVDCDTD